MAAAPVLATGSRRPYRPQAHPGHRDRWSRAAILAALRDWVALTGRPPRRQDWSGERPGRASAAQKRWMREHPRWPSSSCVAAPLRLVERRARASRARRPPADVPDDRRRARARRPRARRRRPRADRDRPPPRRVALERLQLLERARLPALRRAAHLPQRGRVPGVHTPRTVHRPRVDARGRPGGDPRLDARAWPPAHLPRLDAVARSSRPLGGREPALAERRRRLRVLPGHGPSRG